LIRRQEQEAGAGGRRQEQEAGAGGRSRRQEQQAGGGANLGNVGFPLLCAFSKTNPLNLFLAKFQN
jgi:hypothetical protein